MKKQKRRVAISLPENQINYLNQKSIEYGIPKSLFVSMVLSSIQTGKSEIEYKIQKIN